MFAQTNLSRTALSNGREADAINRCQSILALGDENAEALAAKYNVSANDLKALENAITAFTDAQPRPRQVRAASYEVKNGAEAVTLPKAA